MSLAVRDLRVELGSRVVLDGVTMAVPVGEVTVVVGPNGSGKSTLLRVLSGELPPSRGSATMNDVALARCAVRDIARVRAVLVQNVEVAFPLSAGEVVMLGRMPHTRGLETPRDRAAMHRAMRATGVAHLATRPYPRLSGGEKQRVQLARALAQIDTDDAGASRYLLLDEPLAALDPEHQHGSMRVIRRAAGRGIGVLVILHDLALAAQYADRVVVLDSGRLVASGSALDVLRPRLLRETFGVVGRILVHRRSRVPLLLVKKEARAPRRIRSAHRDESDGAATNGASCAKPGARGQVVLS